MDIPFVINDHIVFELTSSRLLVGDVANTPAEFPVPNLTPGLYQLPASAVRKATRSSTNFSTDSARFFLADDQHYQQLQEALPDVKVLGSEAAMQKTRKKLRYQFGFVALGMIASHVFSGDGKYTLSLKDLAAASLDAKGPQRSSREIIAAALRSMNTLICCVCFKAELMGHPDLGDAPRKPSEKRKWVDAMTALAIEQGWQGDSEPSDFGQWTTRCPKCSVQPNQLR